MDEKLKDAIINEDIAFLEANKYNYDINHRFRDEDNDTLLLYSLSDTGSNTFKYFLRNHADIMLVNDEGENIIHSLVYSGQVERMKYLLNQTHFDLNLQTKNGTSPLLLSVFLEKYDIFSFLLKNGANVNLPDNEGNMPIHIACYYGYMRMVKELLKYDANLTTKTLKGNLPLALAINEGQIEVVKFLYKKIYTRTILDLP